MSTVASCAQCARQAPVEEIDRTWWHVTKREVKQGEPAALVLCSAQCVVAYFTSLANVPQ